MKCKPKNSGVLIKKIIFYPVCIALLTGLTLSCTNKKNTFFSRNYHNLTAKYNVFFNAKESSKNSKKKIDESYQDDYTRVLPIWQDKDEEANSAATSETDKTIEKASLLITKHSITARPKKRKKSKSKSAQRFNNRKEYCEWVDDAYLLMGKAHFYQHSFDDAISVFDFIRSEYEMEELRFEAMLWTVRCHNLQNEYSKAQALLTTIGSYGKNFPEQYHLFYNLIYTEMFLRQKRYKEAAKKLEKSIEMIEGRFLNFKERKDRARYKFILAQIYQKLNENKKSHELYDIVIKMNPNYELVFNAKINKAVVSGGNSQQKMKDLLHKMLKDEKNIDYQDQIYYALAQIAEKENETPQALDYYKLSAEKSTTNEGQKLMAFLSLADIYFTQPNYHLSQAYYDSTMNLIKDDHPEYKRVNNISENLNNLVNSLEEVKLQDSLQRIANMSDSQRDLFIESVIENVIRDEEFKKQEEERIRNEKLMAGNTSSSNIPVARGGKWYFYNLNMIDYGATEFDKIWGNRKNKDHWRRINKSISNDFEEETNTNDTLDNKTKEYYLRDLPLSDSLIAVSNYKIQKSLYTAGSIYKEKLKDYPEAIKVFEDLNRRFNKHEYELNSYYKLHKANETNNNTSRAEHYKNLIIQEYPNSKYAKMFTNPNYLNELAANKTERENHYIGAYNSFLNKEYENTINQCVDAEEKYPDTDLIPKYLYLKALSAKYLNFDDVASFKKSLQDLIKKYPDSEVAKSAAKTLKNIK